MFLGAASDEEKRAVRAAPADAVSRRRRAASPRSCGRSRSSTRSEDRHVGAIFCVDARRARRGHGAAGHGVRAVARDPHRSRSRSRAPVSRIVKYVSGVLAIDPAPMVWLQEQGDGLRVANTVGLGAERQQPGAVAARRRAADRQERRARARVRGRQADGLPAARAVRDPRGRARCPSSRPRSRRRCSRAARASTSHDGTPFIEPRRARRRRSSRARCKSQVPGPLLEQVGELSSKLSHRLGNGLISAWRTATDLTANRVGLIVVERSRDRGQGRSRPRARRCRACRSRTGSRDLLAYSVSEQYFMVRRHLGLHVRGEASA